MKQDFVEEIGIPEGVTVTVKDSTITAKGPKGEVTRKLDKPIIKVSVEGNKVNLRVDKGTKREKTSIKTLLAHVNNILKGQPDEHSNCTRICTQTS